MGVLELPKTSSVCIYCGSNQVIKVGSYKNVQRYWCKNCERKFKDDGSLFHSKVKAQCINVALVMYTSGNTIDNIRDYIKCINDYEPAKSVVYGWIRKYSTLADALFSHDHPAVGNIWKMETNHIYINSQKMWIIGLTDVKTEFLFSLLALPEIKTSSIENLIVQAEEKAEISPKVIRADYNTEPVITPKLKEKFEFEFDDLHKGLMKRNFKSLESCNIHLKYFINHHNYFMPEHSLNGKTAAIAAGIDQKFETWADLIKYLSTNKVVNQQPE